MIKDEKEITPQEEQDYFYNMDKIMLFLRSILEIKDSKFIKNTYFTNTSSETIKEYLEFIDDVQDNIDVAKVVYPDVCYWLGDLKKVFEQIYENKLVVEEAKNLFKKG